MDGNGSDMDSVISRLEGFRVSERFPCVGNSQPQPRQPLLCHFERREESVLPTSDRVGPVGDSSLRFGMTGDEVDYRTNAHAG